MAIFRELRFASRTLARTPLVAVAAVVTLALGIGANTTIFSFVKAVLVDPFVFHDQSNTVLIFSENAAQRSTRARVSVPDFRDWHERCRSFDQIAIGSPEAVALTDLKEPLRITAARVSEQFFSFFDAKPSLGRGFVADEYRAGHSVVISQSFWTSHMAADAAAIGRIIHLDGEPYTIVGVMSPGFWFPSRKISMWLPLTRPAGPPYRAARGGLVLAHLRPGITLRQANHDLAAVSRELATLYPHENTGWNARAYEPLEAVMEPNDRLLVAVLFAVVGVLLLVACCNVANLLLAQAAVRRREMAIRTAVGATPWHLVRQSLTESVLLALLAGALGLLMGFWAKDLLVAIFPSEILISTRVVDLPLLGFCLAISLVSVLLFGLAPAWDFARGDPIGALKETRGSGSRTHRLAGAFVSAQVALSVILLVVTGLLLETVRHLHRLDLGCRPGGVVVANVQPSPVRYAGDDKLRVFYGDATERLAGLPRVRSASATSALPVLAEGAPVYVAMPGEQALASERTMALRVTVMPRYFETTGIPLHGGREFSAQDKQNSARVVVVNRVFADRFWQGADPIGRQVLLDATDLRGVPWTIVGVSGNVRPPNIQEPARPQIYLPFSQAPQREMALLVKTEGNPVELLSGVRQAIARLDKDEPVEANTLSRMLTNALRGGAIIVSMLAVFAGLALTMASVGLFALVAYSVNERTREIGIRIALGASQRTVIGLVLGRGLRLAAVGMSIGLLLAAAVTRLLGGLLIETSPWDVKTFVSVSALLILVAAAASYLPARRAIQTDPMTALRQD
jgi:predicted permease